MNAAGTSKSKRTLTLIAEEKIDDEVRQHGILRKSAETPSSYKSEKWQDLTLEKGWTNMQVSLLQTFFNGKDT